MSEDRRPSVADLQRIHSEMPKGQWALTSDVGARSAVLLLNATPRLLEIAASALAYQKAKKTAAKTRATLYRMAFPDTLSAESDAHDKEEIRCRDAFEAALAKVCE